jgi:hypothetical protein
MYSTFGLKMKTVFVLQTLHYNSKKEGEKYFAVFCFLVELTVDGHIISNSGVTS